MKYNCIIIYCLLARDAHGVQLLELGQGGLEGLVGAAEGVLHVHDVGLGVLDGALLLGDGVLLLLGVILVLLEQREWSHDF